MNAITLRHIRKILLLASITLLPVASNATEMKDYSVTPAFIQAAIKPNLLLMVDNSASMYDLAYVDAGKTTSGSLTRNPYYCYDQTYISVKKYEGYFDPTAFYKFVIPVIPPGTLNDGYFTKTDPVSGLAVTLPAACSKRVAGQLCVDIDGTGTSVTNFVALGNYLNWLSASKFDQEKKILTGGKYVSGYLEAESRGCVGQSFVKEANTADFVNYDSPETNNTNTALEITFGVRGPYDAINRSAPSRGGQTFIDLYYKAGSNYDQKLCQDAVTAIVSGTNAEIKTAVDACLGGTSGSTAVTKTKVAFQQSMQACWQLREGHAIGGDDINTVKNQCTDIYPNYATCSSNPDKTCTTATVVADCGAADTCIYGPGAIVPGNPALLCGNEYEGQYYYYQGATASGTCVYNGAACTADTDCTPATFKQCKKTTNACTTDADCPGAGNSCFKVIANTCTTAVGAAGWQLIPGTTEAQMIATHTQFCNDMYVPPVVDPTDSPSNTAQYDNVPAILSGVGLESQLGQPLLSMAARVKVDAAPEGLVQKFKDSIRMGLMTFNFAGSASESPATLAQQKICSNDLTRTCTGNIDCLSPGTCQNAVAGTNNLDGAKITNYIGYGSCSLTVATECATDAHCPAGERCVSAGVGDHVTAGSFINTLGGVRATSWTPYAEAFYNAIGYFAKDPAVASGKNSRSDLRLNTADYKLTLNPSEYVCQPNNILLISDGMSTADRNTGVDDLAKVYTAAGGATSWTTCPPYAGSINVDNMTWLAQHRNIKTFSKSTASTTVPQKASETVKSYVVFTGASNGLSGECNSLTLMGQTATNGGTNLYQSSDYDTLRQNLSDALATIAAGGSSGTAASILSNSEGTGANILQAVFYPSKRFDRLDPTDPDSAYTSANWLGEIQDFWYYLDPFINNSTVREDTDHDQNLDLIKDNVLSFFFDSTDNQTKVKRYRDTNADGLGDTYIDTISPDNVQSIWRAGKLLWERDLATKGRKIYTYLSWLDSAAAGTSSRLTSFTTANYLTGDWTEPYRKLFLGFDGWTDPAASTVETNKLINYIRGTDQAAYRPRKVTIAGCGLADCNREWRLGDIISSTPRLETGAKLSGYDLAPPAGYGDATYRTLSGGGFVNTTTYKNRGMAFAGANDGMLHAFRLGNLDVSSAAGTVKARLNGTDLGKEEWAFVPMNALPYLRYLGDPAYSHLYYVDGPITLADISAGCASADYWNCTKPADGSTWRTVLVGSMGIGGAERYNWCMNWDHNGDGVIDIRDCDSFCTAEDLNRDGVKNHKDCVYQPVVPITSWNWNYETPVGFSSYFAMDVTDPATPKMIWEYPEPWWGANLGFATTGTAIVKINAKDAAGKTDLTKNGRWLAFLASGPTGPIDKDKHQFLGTSDKNLVIYAIDLDPKSTTPNIVWSYDTGIPNAFAGSITNGAIDTDRWNKSSYGHYADDAIYIGYTQKDPATNTWTKGGVLRVVIPDSYNPNDSPWGVFKVSKVIDNIGPVTTNITKLQDRKNHNLWLYFGTGRYYTKDDDMAGQRHIFAVKEPCYKDQVIRAGGQSTSDDLDDTNAACTLTPLAIGDLLDQSGDTPASDIGTKKGWYVVLDDADSANMLGAERIITDPVSLINGSVLFTSFKPTSDLCGFGGNSYLWGFKYDSGAPPPPAALLGRALVQVSTGSFEEIDLRSALTQEGGRKLGTPLTGKPPGDPPPIISRSANKPVKKILHIEER